MFLPRFTTSIASSSSPYCPHGWPRTKSYYGGRILQRVSNETTGSNVSWDGTDWPLPAQRTVTATTDFAVRTVMYGHCGL